MKDPAEDPLRPHTYDGIREYDKRLPNWWLFTLYGTIVFAIGYWVYYHQLEAAPSPGAALEMRMKENQTIAARSSGVIDDDVIWKMSRDPQVVAAGKATFDTTCAACHKPDLTGMIGPNLIDHEWIHGGLPMDLVKNVTEGVVAKGMPTWGPLLGKQKIVEVVSYIMSHHQKGEEIIPVAGWIPIMGAPPAPIPAPAPAP